MNGGLYGESSLSVRHQMTQIASEVMRGRGESWQVMIMCPTFPSGVDRGVLGCSTGGSSHQGKSGGESAKTPK